MAVVVVIREQQDRGEWIAALDVAGISWSGYPRLPRIFRVEDFSSVSFPLRDHPGIEVIEDADRQVRGADQGISLSADLSSANWALPRVIRRKAPWSTRRLKFPLDTYFRCDRIGLGVDFYSFDSGIRTTHVEFTGRATNVYEYYSSGGDGDDFGHGSATASCACGDMVGLARGAEMFSFKCLDSNNAGTSDSVIAAINQALIHYDGRAMLNRPAVANLSIGGFSAAVNSAIASLIDAGIVVVVAAGNTKEDLGVINQYPAESDPSVIVVGGIGPADIPYYANAGGSCWGARLDVSAPSQSIHAATKTNDTAYLQWNGTSFGCGFVSGAVACLLQRYARLSGRSEVEAVRQHMRATATTGRISNAFGLTLPDRLLYLAPDIVAPEAISGLTDLLDPPALIAETASFALTGFSATLNAGLTAETGIFTLTGFDANLGSASGFDSGFDSGFH